MWRQLGEWAWARFSKLGPEDGDAALYGASALFAGLTRSSRPSPCTGCGPSWPSGPIWRRPSPRSSSVVCTPGAASARGRRRNDPAAPGQPGPRARGRRGRRPRSARAPARRHDAGWRLSRIAVFGLVLFGATLVPLALEVTWRSEGNAAQHVQPEVVVIEQAGHRAAQGQDPYHLEVRARPGPLGGHGRARVRVLLPVPPAHDGLRAPSSTHEPIRLTDARIFFSMVTLLVVIGALAMCRGPASEGCGPSRSSPCSRRRPCPWPPGATTCPSWPSAAGHGAGPAPPAALGPGAGVVSR